MSADTVAIAAAFITGVGSVLGARFTIRRVRREEQENCEKRIQAFRNGMTEGLHMEERK